MHLCNVMHFYIHRNAVRSTRMINSVIGVKFPESANVGGEDEDVNKEKLTMSMG